MRDVTMGRMGRIAIVWALLCSDFVLGGSGERSIVAAKSSGKVVDGAVMERVYEEVRTPYKYGVVLRGEDGRKVDCPSVFRHGGKWWMVYIIFDGNGYETAIAESDDLLAWRKVGKILEFSEGRWDGMQAAGYVALQDYAWGGSYELQKYDGRYWLSYIGGAVGGFAKD